MQYTSTYLPENKSVYINAFLLGYPSYHTGLLLDSTIPLHAHKCTRSWPCLFMFILLFRLAAKTYPSTFLPVTTTTCVHAQDPTCSFFILSFRLTAKLYPSTVLLFYMSIDVPLHHYTCSFYFFFFDITCTMTFQFIYWGTYPQIHPKINLPVYLHASLLSNHKDLSQQLLPYRYVLPVNVSTVLYVHRCIC